MQLALLRSWVRVTSVLAPAYAERLAARLFLTPRKRPAVPRSRSGVVPVCFELELLGERLVGWRWGQGGPRVLLVHGWSGRAADMTALAESLAAVGYEALALDMPAHGSSAGTTTNLAIWSRLIPAIGRELGPFIAAVGHSFGGAAVTLALNEGLDATAAVLIAPPLGPLHFIESLRAFIGLPTSRLPGMQRELVRLVGRPIEHFDANRVAARLTHPALILHDRADDEVPFAHGEAIAAAWRGSAFVPVEGEGHYRILKTPSTIRSVTEFIAAQERVAIKSDASGASR